LVGCAADGWMREEGEKFANFRVGWCIL
jgi:hypothetical protein